MSLFLLLACTAVPPVVDTAGTPTDTATAGTPTDTATDTDTTPTDTDTAPVDADADGYGLPEDCDDADDDVHPGAPEEWDGKDGDCDGRVDADGAYSGSMQVDATAIYEGVARPFSLVCPTTLDRTGGVLALTMVCTPDPADELAQLLLGETVTLTAGDDLMGGPTWSGEGTLVSSDGWSTAVDLGLAWPDLDAVTVIWQLDTRSLDANGDGTLRYPAR